VWGSMRPRGTGATRPGAALPKRCLIYGPGSAGFVPGPGSAGFVPGPRCRSPQVPSAACLSLRQQLTSRAYHAETNSANVLISFVVPPKFPLAEPRGSSPRRIRLRRLLDPVAANSPLSDRSRWGD
jgi:hypothetical protein